MADVDTKMQERIAKNDAVFRDANEGIRQAARQYGVRDSVPFVCECADPSCRDLVRLSLDEYEWVRAAPNRFLNVPGHEQAAQGAAVVVERHEGYVVVEKQGHAGDVAAQLDGSSGSRRSS